jgi:hypothetical protein
MAIPLPPDAARSCQLLAIAALLMGAVGADAREPQIQCPGENTVEMRYCAGLALEESNSQLQRKIPQALFQQWQEATRAVCSQAYRPFLQGTIYPQLVLGCDDNLNRALLKEFQPLNNQGDPERMP